MRELLPEIESESESELRLEGELVAFFDVTPA